MTDKSVVIIGLDISLTETGFAIAHYDNEWNQTACELAHFGTKAKDETGQRRDRYHMIVDNILERLYKNLEDYENYEVDLIFVLEHYIFKGAGRTATLAELHGYIKGCLITNYLNDEIYPLSHKIIEVPNGTLKSFITGKGNADKPLMIQKCFERYHRSIKNDNECDAYCLVRFAEMLESPSTSEVERKKWLSKLTHF